MREQLHRKNSGSDLPRVVHLQHQEEVRNLTEKLRRTEAERDEYMMQNEQQTTTMRQLSRKVKKLQQQLEETKNELAQRMQVPFSSGAQSDHMTYDTPSRPSQPPTGRTLSRRELEETCEVLRRAAAEDHQKHMQRENEQTATIEGNAGANVADTARSSLIAT